MSSLPMDIIREYQLRRPGGLRDAFTNGRVLERWSATDDLDTAESPLHDKSAGAGSILTRMTTADQLDVLSVSANDDGDPAGTGANTVRVHGLDANWAEATEDVTMDGTTPVITTGTFIAVNDLVVLTAGSGDGNADRLYCQDETNTYAMCSMRPGENTARGAFYHVPASKQLIIWQWGGGLSTDAETQKVQFLLRVFEGDSSVIPLTYDTVNLTSGEAGDAGLVKPCLHKIPEKSFVLVTAIANGNDVDGWGGFSAIMVDE